MINFRIIININADKFRRIVLDSILELNIVEPHEIILAPNLDDLTKYLSTPIDFFYEVFPGFNYGLILCRDLNESEEEHQRLKTYMIRIVNQVKQSSFYSDFLEKTRCWEDPWFIYNHNHELEDYQRAIFSALDNQTQAYIEPEPFCDLSSSRACLFSQQQRINDINYQVAGLSFSIGFCLGIALGCASIPCFLLGPIGVGVALASLGGAIILIGTLYALKELSDDSDYQLEESAGLRFSTRAF